MSPFLRNVEALRLAERERDMAAKRGSEIHGLSCDARIGPMKGGMAVKARWAEEAAQRLRRIERLRGMGLDTKAIAEEMDLTIRQVRFAERRP